MLADFWFWIIAVLFIGYFVLEGFDFGVGMLMPFLGSSHDEIEGDKRRRVLLNTIGPVWDGNEVWLITAGGALFAAFGGWYATMFSAFYLPLFIILLGLIVRVVAIEWRSKINDPKWRLWCDVGIGLGSWIPAILWGVAFANLVRGLEIDADHQYTAGFWNLLNGYALLGGLTTLLAFLTHGSVFLSLKTAGVLQQDAMTYAFRLSIPTAAVAGAFLLWTQFEYGKTWTWIPVALAIAGAAITVVATYLRREGIAFAATSVAIGMVILTLFGALFPNVIPSLTDPAFNLTVDNTSSSHYTLVVMTWTAVVMVPIVLLYQGYTYWVFRQRISTAQIPEPTGLPLREPTPADKGA